MSKFAWVLPFEDGFRLVRDFPGSSAEDVEVAAQGNYLTTAVPDEASPGWLYDGLARLWAAPPAERTPRNRVMTVIAYKQRFSFQERAAIYVAAGTDPLVAELVRSLDDPRLTDINLDHPETLQGLQYLASQGLILADRIPDLLEDAF